MTTFFERPVALSSNMSVKRHRSEAKLVTWHKQEHVFSTCVAGVSVNLLFAAFKVTVPQYISESLLKESFSDKYNFPKIKVVPDNKLFAGWTRSGVTSFIVHSSVVCSVTGASHASHLGCPSAYSSRVSYILVTLLTEPQVPRMLVTWAVHRPIVVEYHT